MKHKKVKDSPIELATLASRVALCCVVQFNTKGVQNTHTECSYRADSKDPNFMTR
jgi:hypothetical protein